MKKTLLIFLCVAVAVVGVGIFYKIQKTGPAVEDVLPQEPLVYIQLNDVTKNMEEMAATPLWKAVANINYDLLISRKILSPQQGMFVNLIRTQISEISTNPLAKKLFGRQVAFAVYQPDGDIGEIVNGIKTLNFQTIGKLFSGLFLVTRVDSDVQLAEFLSRSLSQFGANVSQGQVEYKGETIRMVSVSGLPIKIAFVRLKDLLVIGIGDEVARASIDAYKQGKTSLARSSSFERIKSTFLDPSGIVGFFDMKTFFEMGSQAQDLFGLSPEGLEGAAAQEEWEVVIERMAGLETFAFSSQPGPIMKFSNHVLLNPNKLSPDHAALYTCPAQVNETASFIPKEVLAYQWSNCLDPVYYWGEVKKGIARDEVAASRINEIETAIGLSIEGDVLPAFGEEFGGYLSDIQLGGFSPIPKLLFFVRIKDRAKAQQLLDKLQNQPMALFQEETYKGVPLKYVVLPLGESVQPGYCFLGDYLLIATSSQLIKASIDASTNAAMSLKANPEFKDVNSGLTGKNRSVQFIRIGEIIEKAKGVINWSNQWVAARDQKVRAFEAGSQKPLEEVQASINAGEGELQQMRGRIDRLDDEIWNLEIDGEDASAQKARMNSLKVEIEAKEREIVGEYERKADLEKILQENAQSVPDPATRQAYLNEVVYPLLDGLKSIEAFGMRSTFEGDALKSLLFLKMAK